jgi:protein-S-isoprenylcysteine O-methyltransferase Ste14
MLLWNYGTAFLPMRAALPGRDIRLNGFKLAEMVSSARCPGAMRFPPPVAFLAGLAAGFSLQYFYPAQLVSAPNATYAKLLGILLLGFGVGLSALAIWTFRRASTTVRPDRASTALVTSGPFRFTRNPMYLGLSLIHAAVSFMANALWPLVFLLPVVAFIRYYVIAREERHLLSRFGGEYHAYLRSVRRWF